MSALRLFRSSDPADQAKAAEVAGAAWGRLPWRARLMLLLHRQWRWLGRWPVLRRWIIWAHVRLLGQVLTEARSAGVRKSHAHGDRLIQGIITVVGIAVILVRHLGHLLLALGAFALLVPFLLWPALLAGNQHRSRSRAPRG